MRTTVLGAGRGERPSPPTAPAPAARADVDPGAGVAASLIVSGLASAMDLGTSSPKTRGNIRNNNDDDPYGYSPLAADINGSGMLFRAGFMISTAAAPPIAEANSASNCDAQSGWSQEIDLVSFPELIKNRSI